MANRNSSGMRAEFLGDRPRKSLERQGGLVVCNIKAFGWMLFAGVVTASAPPGLGAKLSDSVPKGWIEDFGLAKKTADAEGKFVFLAFSGSDWCGWCMKLEREVYSQKPFVDRAQKNFVLTMIDCPQNQGILSKLAYAQNRPLAQTYSVRGFPTGIVCDSDGTEIGRVSGYAKGGPDAYLERMQNLVRGRKPKKGMDETEMSKGVECMPFMKKMQTSVEQMFPGWKVHYDFITMLKGKRKWCDNIGHCTFGHSGKVLSENDVVTFPYLMRTKSGGGMEALVTTSVVVSDGMRLSYSAALAPEFDTCSLVVLLNGKKELLRHEMRKTEEWETREVDLSSFRGRKVKLELYVDKGVPSPTVLASPRVVKTIGNGDGKCTLGVHIRKLSVLDSTAASDSTAK